MKKSSVHNYARKTRKKAAGEHLLFKRRCDGAIHTEEKIAVDRRRKKTLYRQDAKGFCGMPTLAHKAYLDSFPEEWERICPGGSVAYERQVHRDALTPEEETDLVLTVARTELADELRGYVDARWQRVVSIFENWWNKYRTTMQDIEGRCEETTEKLDHYLEVMGYA